MDPAEPNEPVELDPELRECLHDGWIYHPLVHTPFTPELAPIVNNQRRAKERAIEEACESRDWSTVVFLHERPYRARAFAELLPTIADPSLWWELFKDVWIDTENFWQERDTWLDILDATPDSGSPMSEPERRVVASLPSRVQIWRGAAGSHDELGMSWTLSREKAVWFAHRFAGLHGDPILLSAEVDRQHIIAYFAGRNEDEIVIDPAELVGVTSTELSAAGEH